MESEQYPIDKIFQEEEFPVRVNISVGVTGPSCGTYYHPELEFQLIRRGSGDYFIRDTAYAWQENAVFIIHKNEIHSCIPADPNAPAKRFCLMLSSRLVQRRSLPAEILRKLNDTHCVILSDRQAAMGEFLLTSIAEELEKCRPSWKEVVISHVETFLTLLYRALDEESPVTRVQEPVIQEVINYLDKSFHENVSLGDVSNQFGLSPYTLSRKFKRYVGLGFREYLIHRRIVEAQKLLEETDMKILTIGLNVGFESISSFYHDFQAMTGLSPAAYRRSAKMNLEQIG